MISLTNLKKSALNPVKGQWSHVKGSSGFTLLELLIVIAIIAILSIALVFMLNPAETLKKARDAQRISDLKSVKTALGIMLTASSTPKLDSGSAICTTNTTGGSQTAKIAYSAASPTVTVTSVAQGSDGSGNFDTAGYQVGAVSAGKVDGTGWIPVNLKALTGGTPISSFPVDPVNTVTAVATSTDLVYRYACQNLSLTSDPSYIFEIDARLESNAYTVEDSKMTKDGGDNDNLYESGNSLNLLPTAGIF
ncbi:MAG: hypothetical protein UW25_C0011G0013 [Candidatus Nomurabacteria bacterium GW2011_GWB1_44_12]|uniref:Uncharacterized protein n=1 Tax=Candidatus Nomurabacteria bacterium GW2011_GWB1_44_12 TaxID=1618748 RepID=A0A837I6H7_9BACT|nr:MAG: hypothetical protein UW25_C0011G0013 [Candidatus Nomurabacteria bacterium GW2011_GWB1_44_12]